MISSRGLRLRFSTLQHRALSSYIGAIDQGTSSTRFIIYDEKLNKIASHQVEVFQEFLNPGWSQMDPMKVVESAKQCIAGAMAQCPDIKAADFKGIGITNQRETTLVWDTTTGRPLYDAIVWLDSRTKGVVEDMIAQHGGMDALRPICGLPMATYFSGMKLRWLLENVPEVQAAAKAGTARFGTIESWLAYNLTGGLDGGVHVTDSTNASRTMMMDLQTAQWHQATVEKFKVPESMLPKIITSAEHVGELRCGSALDGVPITGMIGDQQSACAGQMLFEAGMAKNTYGTGAFLLMNSGTEPIPSQFGLLTTMLYQMGPASPRYYALEGSVAIAGVGIKWLRDSLQLIQHPSEMGELSASVEGTEGLYFVPAFSGLLAPHWRSDARGVMVGITQFHTKAHMCRAMLEAIAFQTGDVVSAMTKDLAAHNSAVGDLQVLRVDGGVANSPMMLQIQADVLDKPVQRPSDLETTAKGAAVAAGIGSGLFSSTNDVLALASGELTTIEPKINAEERRKWQAGWDDAVQRSFNLAT